MNNIPSIKDSFIDANLYGLALTHRSWVNENVGDGHNERLEFLGDAVLEFVVSSFLFKNFLDKEEGFLTILRANIVDTKNLAALAKKLQLGKHIKLSKGEEQGGGRENDSLLADTVEALIGAIYIDSGFSSAKKFITENLLNDIDNKLREPLKDAKSRLQELVQAQGSPTPRYTVVKEIGPDHDKNFEVEVQIGGKVAAIGTGKSKNRAEQSAAESALAYFEAEEVK